MRTSDVSANDIQVLITAILIITHDCNEDERTNYCCIWCSRGADRLHGRRWVLLPGKICHTRLHQLCTSTFLAVNTHTSVLVLTVHSLPSLSRCVWPSSQHCRFGLSALFSRGGQSVPVKKNLLTYFTYTWILPRTQSRFGEMGVSLSLVLGFVTIRRLACVVVTLNWRNSNDCWRRGYWYGGTLRNTPYIN